MLDLVFHHEGSGGDADVVTALRIVDVVRGGLVVLNQLGGRGSALMMLFAILPIIEGKGPVLGLQAVAQGGSGRIVIHESQLVHRQISLLGLQPR